MGRKRSSPVNVLFGWVRRQSVKVKTTLGVTLALCAVVALKLSVRDHNHFFVAAESVHAVGIMVLIYKLATQKTCSGLSLRTQELTCLFLAVRLICSGLIETNIHTVLDFTTLFTTAWVVYMIRMKLKSTYIKELDNMPWYYLVIPCTVLAVLIHPPTRKGHILGIMWAFCIYLESVSVLPQLRLMQNAKMIEPFTAHYVFALGVARFFSCAHWIIQVYETRGKYLFLTGNFFLWFPAVLLAETVQTFILADFCWYYVKSVMDGKLILKMPV